MENGSVEVTRTGTVQVKQYHPVSVAISLRLPIEQGEAPEQAIARVDTIVSDVFDGAMNEVIEDGFKWTGK